MPNPFARPASLTVLAAVAAGAAFTTVSVAGLDPQTRPAGDPVEGTCGTRPVGAPQ